MRALCEATERSGAEIVTDCLVQTLVQGVDRRVEGVVARIDGEEHPERGERQREAYRQCGEVGSHGVIPPLLQDSQ